MEPATPLSNADFRKMLTTPRPNATAQMTGGFAAPGTVKAAHTRFSGFFFLSL